MTVNIVVLDGDKKIVYPLSSKKSATIGRSGGCDLSLNDPTISSLHCHIFCRDGSFYIEDKGSSNGVRVNGERVDVQQVLSAGDIISLGKTKLELLFFMPEKNSETIIHHQKSKEETTFAGQIYSEGKALGYLFLLYKFGKLVHQHSEIKTLLEELTENLLSYLQVKRGCIFFRNGEEISIYRERKTSSQFSAEPFQISNSIVNTACKKAIGTVSSNTFSDHRFDSSSSVRQLNIHSVVCVPILGYNGAIGALYLDTLFTDRIFDEDDLELMTAIGRFCGIAIEHKKAEAKQRETNNRLQQTLDKLKKTQQQVIRQERLQALGQMASGIAHDFNNALSPICGYSDLLLQFPQYTENRDKARHYLQMINTSAQDAAKIICSLRDFYRYRKEQDALFSVDLNSLVEQAVLFTQPKWKDQALASGITIDVKKDLQEIPEIQGDESELREILLNLIFNAVEAMPRGGTISLKTYTRDKFVFLEVRDDGIGMSEEAKLRCLEPFFSTKGNHGTGMGLAMVYGILQRHKGEIEVFSEVEEGTCFRICLPVPENLPSPTIVDSSEVSRKYHLLLIEDEAPIRELLIDCLEAKGHTCEVATNGLEGLEKFQQGKFDIVITDRAMPKMNGDQLALAIRKLRPDVPILLLTGFGDMMEAVGEKPPGVDFIFSKPVTLEKLRKMLDEAAKLLE